MKDEICTICGINFNFNPVPRSYNFQRVFINDVEVPACNSCTHVAFDSGFRLMFGFLVGTEITYTRNQLCKPTNQ